MISPTLYKAKNACGSWSHKAEFNVDVEIVSETVAEEVRSRTRAEEGSRASSLSAENVLPLTTSGDNETEVSLGQSLLLPSRAREERGAMPSDCSTCSGRLGGARGC